MRFSVGEIAIFKPDHGFWRGLAGPGSECELKWPCETLLGAGWMCLFPGDPSPSRPDGLWRVPESHLRKRRPPPQYKDQHTPAEQSFPELIEDLNKVTANQEESR